MRDEPPADAAPGGPKIGRAQRVSERDAAAVVVAQEYRTSHLPAVRARATGWITMLSSVAGVVTAASVISAVGEIGSFTGLHWVAVALLVAGVVGIVLAMMWAHHAAHGDGGLFAKAREIVDRQNPVGAAAAWDAAVEDAANDGQKKQTRSMIASVASVACLLLAFALLWAAVGDGGSAGVCVDLGTAVIEVAGFDVTESTDVTLIPCP